MNFILMYALNTTPFPLSSLQAYKFQRKFSVLSRNSVFTRATLTRLKNNIVIDK